MQTINWHIGCSGFYYKEWKELFYPKGLAQSKWFSYYTQHFNTLEINNTFYRFPEFKLLDNWYQKAPPDFSFSVKVTRQITHYQKFKDTQGLLDEFYSVVREGLKEKLACVLFQLPPGLKYNMDLLQDIIRQTNLFFNNVIEFRNISWWRKEVFELLKENNITFCGVSYPGLIDDAVTSLPLSYYRFHGVPKLFYSKYEHSFLDKIVQQVKDGSSETAYLYFNNTASAAALENAQYIKSLLGV
jgi:uncharacterized protein YecE (DUF72 family)